MDNKIVIELIKKDIEELRMLIVAIEGHAEPSDLIIDICKSKANVLLQEISLLGNEKKGAVSDYKPDDLVSTESAHAEIVQKEDSEEKKDPVPDTTTTIQIESESVADTLIHVQKAESGDESIEPEIDSSKPEKVIAESSHDQRTDFSDKGNGNGKVLGESFIKEPSLNERFSNLAQKQTKIGPKPISNLKKAIGINDRFLFTRELFENSMGEFEAAIDVIDGLDGLSEAISYLEDNFKWQKNEASLKFIDLVKRRFNN